jgi:hypothetical protein
MFCSNKILCKVQVRMKDRSHFCRDYCASGLLGELGVKSTCHSFRFLLDSHSFLWRPLGQTIWVHSPSSHIWGCFKSFFPWLKQHIYPLLSSLHRGKQINFKRLFALSFLFQHHFWHVFLTHIRHTRGSM